MSKDLILMNGLGIVPSVLVPPGTIAVMLHGGEVRVVPAEDLRVTVENIGSDKIEGLTMAPEDFEKLLVVVERQSEKPADLGDDTQAPTLPNSLDEAFHSP